MLIAKRIEKIEAGGRKMDADKMPVLFIGHGSPINAIEDNEFSRGWHEAAARIPRPKTILCISAHWETWGTLVTGMERPRTIHDFGGFPRALYEAQYLAPGSKRLAEQVREVVRKVPVNLDEDWGLDHGAWSVLIQMYPEADIPVVQLSLDYTKTPQEHYNLAKELAPLRQEGVLILGSGNIVHNLRRVVLPGGWGDFNQPYALEWAQEASDLLKKLILTDDHAALINYPGLGEAVQMAIPTLEHYLPMLYILALKQEGEVIELFNDKPLAGSLTMTSLVIDQATRIIG
jgi:4,5-DOPA dioxygenase extradiol